ncbi:TIGR02678 family protein [Actinomadura sp. NEAU-AAG7]|uniref:TIGR02678 family protein n=1 Tax=Actinomadura sp. NEAU-AAG7 TaxID=2839640 RepID=UPI001BE4C8E5|nr:TIGR02678 family protein [Actinomadura sp. NEAU-AAG7]MBT2207499.1 TIGR02678 family protein [Actinomadura sp. NEAU-AAG7]
MGDEEDARRRAALRALLRRPLLTAESDPEVLVLVRRHQAELRDWLSRETGWRLQVDAEMARLFKTVPTLDDGTHPARGRAGEPFGRRRYVVLCLALAVLERADAQTTLGRLAEEVLNAAAEPDLAFPFSLDSRAERSDLVAVVRLLLGLGVLRRVSGDEESYLSATGDVLYDVRRAVLAALPTGARGPSTVTAAGFEERLAELVDEPVPDTDELRNRALRRGLTRRLLEDPVVYYDDLDDAERAYLVSQRAAITRRIEEAAGLVAEARAEGVAMVDPDDELTDVRMPEQRTDGHVTLLVAEYLSDRDGAGWDELTVFVQDMAERHKAFWRKGVTEPGAAEELLDLALGKLAALRLVEVTPGRVRARPAIARYAVEKPTIRLPRGVADRPLTENTRRAEP